MIKNVMIKYKELDKLYQKNIDKIKEQFKNLKNSILLILSVLLMIWMIFVWVLCVYYLQEPSRDPIGEFIYATVICGILLLVFVGDFIALIAERRIYNTDNKLKQARWCLTRATTFMPMGIILFTFGALVSVRRSFGRYESYSPDKLGNILLGIMFFVAMLAIVFVVEDIFIIRYMKYKEIYPLLTEPEESIMQVDAVPMSVKLWVKIVATVLIELLYLGCVVFSCMIYAMSI